MAYRDYLHCEKCDCKLIYDGYDNIRDDLQQKFNLPEDKWTSPLICPNCLNQLKYELEHLKKTCSLLTNLLFSPDTKREIVKIKRKITSVESPVPKCEVWICAAINETNHELGRRLMDTPEYRQVLIDQLVLLSKDT